MDYKAFGRRIRERRREKDMTQQKLATAIGVSSSFIGHIERGTRRISLETLALLCDALNSYPDDLLADSLLYPENNMTYVVFGKIRKILYPPPSHGNG